MSCNYKRNLLRDTNKIIRENRDQGSEKIIPLLKDYLKSIKDTYSSIGDIDSLVNLEEFVSDLNRTLSLYGFNTFKSPEAVVQLIRNPNQNIEIANPPTTQQLVQDTDNSSVLDSVYLGVDSLKNKVIKQFSINLRKCILFDDVIIENNKILNDKINVYKEKLLNQIYEFFLKPEHGNYKGEKSLEALTLIFNERIGNKYKDFNELERAYLNAAEDVQIFNAYNTLFYFDSILNNVLGKAIYKDIKGNYVIESKATNMFWSNQKDDDIDVSKSINNISKLIITTLPLYSANNTLIPDSYITFNQFSNLIARIKDLSWNYVIRTTKINEKSEEGFDLFNKENLSQISKDYIKSLGENVTIATIINNIRLDARKALITIFDILLNSTKKEQFSKLFNIEERMVLQSLYNGLFKSGSGNSLVQVQDFSGYWKNDYLSYILQTCDSIFPVKNKQYYIEEDGTISSRSLKSSTISGIKRSLNDAINIINSPKVKILYSEYDQFRGVTVTINNGKITINNSSKVNISNVDQKNLTNFMLEIIKQILPINITEQFINNYTEIRNLGSSENTIQELFNFCSGIIYNQFVSTKVLETLNKYSNNTDKVTLIENTIKNYYNDDSLPKVKINYKNIDLVPQKQLEVLEALAVTQAVTDGLYSQAQDKDSEGKALATTSPSRLLGSLTTYFELIKNNPESPCNDFLIIQNPKILKGINTLREVKSLYDQKQVSKFNTREFTEVQFLYDFILPILKNEDINIITSVNSDKTTIATMDIFLSPLMNILGEKNLISWLSNKDSSTLYNYINQQFSKYYGKIISNIENEYLVLSQDPIWKQYFGDFILKYNPNSFKQFNKIIIDNGLNIREIIDKISRNTKIDINEQLHFIFKDGTVRLNKSLLSLYNRFSGIKQWNIPTSEQFWKLKHVEVINDLINNKCLFNLLENEKLYSFLHDNMPSWISKSGKLIFGKYKGIDITSEIDILNIEKLTGKSNLMNNLDQLIPDLEINPLLEKFSLIDYLFSQQYLLTTVGSHINHPSKNVEANDLFTQYIQDEASRYQAQHKRNVSQTAAMHEFRLNQLNGTRTTYNIAVIQDINDYVANLAGTSKEISPFDGATIADPFTVHLENNSLDGEYAGVHKKTFVHFYDERMGTGGIIKTAVFGITNSWLRNSPFLQRMFENMCDIPWKDKQGNDTYLDITQGGPYEQFFQENGLFYRIEKITYKGEGEYNIEYIQVNKYGEPIIGGEVYIDNVVGINSNYKVWKYLFQGLNSCSINSKTKTLTSAGKFGETSITNVVQAMNKVGELNEGYFKAVDQESFYQPMKHSDTHYLVTEGAIKQGANNFNTKDWYYKDGQYNRFRINMYQAGIQLDKEHVADNSEISMMTQVISACAALGYTWNEANKIYKALYNLTLTNLKPLFKSLSKSLSTKDSSNFRMEITKIILEAMKTSNKSKDGLIYTLTKQLVAKYNKSQLQNSDIIPISSGNVFDKVASILSSNLTSLAIKLKFSGILSVLCPSYEIMKLYGDRLYSSFNDISEIKALQTNYYDNIPVTKFEIGRTYKVINTKTQETRLVHIQSPIVPENSIFGDPNIEYVGYYDFKLKPEEQAFEYIINGRNLASYNCYFNDKYNMYDIVAIRDAFLNNDNSKVQDILATIKEGNFVDVINENGKVETIQIQNLRIQPYEVIMPKIFAEKLGLTIEDNLYELYSNPDSFKKKLLSNLQSRVLSEKNYTVIAKKLNGQHTYILHKDDFNKSEGLVEIPINDSVKEGDRLYIIDGQEVIVTDSIEYYLKELDYNTIYVSEESKRLQEIWNLSKGIKKLKSWRYSVSHGEDGDFNLRLIKQNNKDLGSISVDGLGNVQDNYLTDLINTLSIELYNSFKETLEVIAARIPAQSMQSFMAMKVVAYEDFDINTAYVSTHQLWLQGSDLDIDCVSLLACELDKSGKYVGWSPYFDLSDMENSKQLDYPTGKDLNLVEITSPYSVVRLLNNFGIALHNDKCTLSYNDFKTFVQLINELSRKGEFPLINDSNIQLCTDALNETKGSKYDNEDTKLIFSTLLQMINDHNNYTYQQEIFTKNFIVHQMLNVIKNPANQKQAMTSVDDTTKILKKVANKSEAGKQLLKATPGNPINKYQSIEDNQVGKDVIGISAVGLKSFFAITQWANTIAQTGDRDLIQKELFSNPVEIQGKTYYSVANINYQNQHILNTLSRAETGEDVALLISAFLSLATDNAKELCLAKLNANASMADMYIYGLTIGIDFKILGNLLMSDIGNVVSSYLKGSVFTDKFNLNSIDKVIDFIEDPYNIIKKVFSSIKLYDSNYNIFSWIGTHFAEFYQNYSDRSISISPFNFKNYFNEITRKIEESESLDILKDLNNLRMYVYNTTLDTKNKYLVNQLVDSIEEIALNKYKITKAKVKLGDTAWEDFKKLRKGAKEFSTIGRLLGLNQGLKNSTQDFLAFIEDFESLLVEGNFEEFMLNKSYRDKCIDHYETISFNPLKIVTQVPHYWGYLQTAYIRHKSMYTASIKYRTLYNYLPKINELIGFIELPKKLKNLKDLIDYHLINNYFINNDIKFSLNAGQPLITLDSNLNSNKSPVEDVTTVYLGNQGGNATFKNLVEQYIIPYLKEGYTNFDKKYHNVALSNNKFIKSLKPNIYTLTPSYNPAMVYSLGINMSPRNEEQDFQLQEMQNAFDQLTIDFDFGDMTMPIKDIFYYYNLITYNGKQGESSLTRIFDNYMEYSSQAQEFLQSIKDLDVRESDLIFLTDDEIINWCTPIGSSFNNYNNYVYNINKNTFEVQLLQKSEYGFEATVSPKIDYDLFLHRPSKSDVRESNIEVNSEQYKIVYDYNTGKLISVQGLSEDIIKFINPVYNPETKEYSLDVDLIKKCIENKLTCSV